MQTQPFAYSGQQAKTIRDSIDPEHSLKDLEWVGQFDCITQIVRQGRAKQDYVEVGPCVNPRDPAAVKKSLLEFERTLHAAVTVYEALDPILHYVIEDRCRVVGELAGVRDFHPPTFPDLHRYREALEYVWQHVLTSPEDFPRGRPKHVAFRQTALSLCNVYHQLTRKKPTCYRYDNNRRPEHGKRITTWRGGFYLFAKAVLVPPGLMDDVYEGDVLAEVCKDYRWYLTLPEGKRPVKADQALFTLDDLFSHEAKPSRTAGLQKKARAHTKRMSKCLS